MELEQSWSQTFLTVTQQKKKNEAMAHTATNLILIMETFSLRVLKDRNKLPYQVVEAP